MVDQQETPWIAMARERLERVVGLAKAAAVVIEILEELGKPTLHDADDLARFGDALSSRAGFLGPVGVSLRTHAMLRGSHLARAS